MNHGYDDDEGEHPATVLPAQHATAIGVQCDLLCLYNSTPFSPKPR